MQIRNQNRNQTTVFGKKLATEASEEQLVYHFSIKLGQRNFSISTFTKSCAHCTNRE